MSNWIEEYQVGRLVSGEKLVAAEQRRRLARSRRFGHLPLVVKCLLLLVT
jgi:hypothetical protein